MKRLFTILATVCMLFSMTVTSFAYNIDGNNILPAGDIFEQYKDEYPYAVLCDDGTGYWLYLLAYKPGILSGKLMQDGSEVGYKSFKHNYNEQKWYPSATSTGAFSVDYSTVKLSSFDIKNGGNTIMVANTDFFIPPPPLAEVIQGVTGEAMMETLPTLGGAMMTLTVCGVGCLALLAVLKLFGKRSLIFRS